MKRISGHQLAWLLAIVLGVSVFTLYFLTLAPGVLGGDPGELQFVPTFLGVTHPSGYPLQVLLDKLWVSIIPWGSVAWRTNLLSAVVATLGVLLIYAYGYLSVDRVTIALLGASMLGISTVYWSQAVLADKYAMNGLLTAGLILTSFSFWRKPTIRTLTFLVFIIGLSLAHHRALAVFLPPAGLLILIRGRRLLLKWRTWAFILPAFLLPLSLYLFVYFARKDIPPHFISTFTPQIFLDYLLFWGSRGQVRFSPSLPSLLNYWLVFLQNFFWPLLLFSGLGLIFRYREDKKRLGWLVFLTGSFLLSGYMAANYENFEIVRRYVYFIPSYVALSALVMEGVAGWYNLLATKSTAQWPQFLLITILFVIVFSPLPHRYQTQWREQHVAEPLDIWRQILKSGQMADRTAASLALVEEPDALIVADWEQATPLWYAQLIDGNCRQCIIRHYINRLDVYRREYPNRPLYVSRTLPGAVEWSNPTSVGPLVRLDVAARFNYNRHGVQVLDIAFDNGLILRGLRWVFGSPSHRPGDLLSFELIWQRSETETAPPPYAISLRLIGPDGQVWQGDQAAPVLGMHPFDSLAPGQVISDFYEIPIPFNASPGEYQVQVVLYQTDEAGGFNNAGAFAKNGILLGQSPIIYSFQVLQ